jgi:hypothetical protein
MKKSSMIKPKKFASGGGSNRMFGTGDRAKTAPSDAANQQAPGRTGHLTKTVRQSRGSDDEAGDMGGTGGESRPRRPAA